MFERETSPGLTEREVRSNEGWAYCVDIPSERRSFAGAHPSKGIAMLRVFALAFPAKSMDDNFNPALVVDTIVLLNNCTFSQ